jgi:pyruvate/oxaloacetate carboxyltransferase
MPYIPGSSGMLSNLVNQMKEAGKENQLQDVLMKCLQ